MQRFILTSVLFAICCGIGFGQEAPTPNKQEKPDPGLQAFGSMLNFMMQMQKIEAERKREETRRKDEQAKEAKLAALKADNEAKEKRNRLFEGTVNIFLDGAKFDEGRPSITSVQVIGFVEINDKNFMEVKKIGDNETWLVDTSRIIAVRIVKTSAAKAVTP